MKNRKLIGILIYAAVLMLVFSWILGLFDLGGNSLTYSQVVSLFQQEQVSSFVVEGDHIQLKLYEEYEGKTTYTVELSDPDGFRQDFSF